MNKKAIVKKQNLEEGKDALERLVAWDYTVQQFSEIHFRVNGRLDVWPSTKKWWDSRRNVTGVYDELESFVKMYLPQWKFFF